MKDQSQFKACVNGDSAPYVHQFTTVAHKADLAGNECRVVCVKCGTAINPFEESTPEK